jgi:MFS family permease
MALVTETWPSPLRARACSYVALGWQAGVLAAALVTPALLPIIGWRGMFLVGLIPGLVAFVVRLYVGEPNIFLNTMKAGRTKMPVALLVKDAATAKITLGCSLGRVQTGGRRASSTRSTAWAGFWETKAIGAGCTAGYTIQLLLGGFPRSGGSSSRQKSSIMFARHRRLLQ